MAAPAVTPNETTAVSAVLLLPDTLICNAKYCPANIGDVPEAVPDIN